ncbi:Csa1 family protein [Macrococcus capreoli]|uniref:Csa1 family protein n=1 Tax=Macrococcus capreoli TaxID=2982690 RepID=UPI003EE76EC0
MEGFRDKEFDKDDKGTWIVSSYFAEQKDANHPLISKGVVLFLNRNDKTAKGNFIVNKIHTKNDIDETKEYPVTVKDNKIIPIKNVTKEIKEEIDKYRFLVQDESFDDLSKFKKIKSRHNEQMPLFTIDYQLNENNNVNQWVQKHYKLQKRKAELYIEKTGNLEGSSVGDFKFEINYNNTKKDKLTYYTESIFFQPTKEK